jgi:hypothetical protein
MNKTKAIKLQEEIINIFKREKLAPADSIFIIEIVRTNCIANLIMGALSKSTEKDNKK